jgi:hypothetical protein
MRLTRKRKITLGTIAMFAVAGLAFAYWTGTGTGTGTGTVGTSGTVTIDGTVAAGSSPGTDTAVSFTAANATSSPIRIADVHLESVAVDTGHSTCVSDDFTMVDATENHQVPANATAEALPTNGSLHYANTNVNQDACQGATLTLTLSST